MNLGKSIKLALIHSDMTAIELAEKAGISDSQLSLISNNKRGASVKTITAISKALGMPASKLIELGEVDINGGK